VFGLRRQLSAISFQQKNKLKMGFMFLCNQQLAQSPLLIAHS
jgi:hypothetical protein